jgi:hypothetical protein
MVNSPSGVLPSPCRTLVAFGREAKRDAVGPHRLAILDQLHPAGRFLDHDAVDLAGQRRRGRQVSPVRAA